MKPSKSIEGIDRHTTCLLVDQDKASRVCFLLPKEHIVNPSTPTPVRTNNSKPNDWTWLFVLIALCLGYYWGHSNASPAADKISVPVPPIGSNMTRAQIQMQIQDLDNRIASARQDLAENQERFKADPNGPGMATVQMSMTNTIGEISRMELMRANLQSRLLNTP
jgi:hypothetical protein